MTITRRVTLAALAAATAAVPAATMPAIAGPEPDPIYAAMERAREAYAIFAEFLHRRSVAENAHRDEAGRFLPLPNAAEMDVEEDRTSEAVSDANWDLINTVPTTLAGVVAALAFARDRTEFTGVTIFSGDEDFAVFMDSIGEAVGRHVLVTPRLRCGYDPRAPGSEVFSFYGGVTLWRPAPSGTRGRPRRGAAHRADRRDRGARGTGMAPA